MDWEPLTLWASLVIYVLAGSLAIFGVVLRKPHEKAVLALLVPGLALNTVSIALRWERLGHGPYITMFEILLSNIWSLLAIYLLAYWRIPAIRPTAAVVMPILFVMMGWLLVTSPHEGHLPATYHTVWLFVHIAFGKLFLGNVLVAVGISGVILLREARQAGSRFARLPDDSRLDELSFRFMAIGMIFETLMLIAGAIWAQDAWGRYWAWDPLETWSFLTWLSLAFALHARVAYKVSPRTGALMVLAVFALAFLTFFGVPFVSTAPHKGAV
ncbi:MAG: cytochrome c biogenesis protein CcsA [Nitrosomonadales bacterium]|nr:cytochrome c biogenesis protein CcsA [Nitrosomonadales bacterium]